MSQKQMSLCILFGCQWLETCPS